MPTNKQTKQRANSPFELFEQFEQSDDVRLCTKGRMARGGTNRIWCWTRAGSPLAKLSTTEYIRTEDKNEVIETRKEQERRWWCYGFYYGKVDEGEKGWWVCITGKQGRKVLSAESCWEHVAKS